MMKLLIQHGANVTCIEPSTKNTILHLLTSDKKFDLIQAFYFYQQNPVFFQNAQNQHHLTIYKLSTVLENRKMAKFIFDALLYSYLPVNIPLFLAMFLILFFYMIIHYEGYLLGIVIWICCFVGIAWLLLQHYLIRLRDRVFKGFYLGIWLVISWNFLHYNYHLLTLSSKWMIIISASILSYLFYLLLATPYYKPLIAKKEIPLELIKKIIESSPSEGTDEENHLLLTELQASDPNLHSHNNNIDNNNNIPKLSSTITTTYNHNNNLEEENENIEHFYIRHQMIKDSFTGKVSIIKQKIIVNHDILNNSNNNHNHNHSRYQTKNESNSLMTSENNNNNHHHSNHSNNQDQDLIEEIIRIRSLGPRICGHCLCDKRIIQFLHTHQPIKNNNSDNNNINPRSVISLASHCHYCQQCVIDQDHHCSYLGYVLCTIIIYYVLLYYFI
jgi:hypothetical protein